MSGAGRGKEAGGVPALIARVAERVDAWRGYALGPASEAWPGPGRYRPTREGEGELSDTSMQLLAHWFRATPHELGRGGALFRYWPHQRRFVETVMYLHEVCGLRAVDALWDAFEVPRDFTAFDPWPKLGGQLATGSGKTKMMSLLIAWTVLNAKREGVGHLGIGPQVVVVAPGLFVKERLLFDFQPDAGRASVFRADPVVAPALERDFDLAVYGPETAPLRLGPRDAALIVTNVHQLMRDDEAQPVVPEGRRQQWLAFEAPDPRRLEDTGTPLLARFRRGAAGVLVLNDEAHHVGDEPAHQRFEEQAQSKRGAGIEGAEDMAWIRSLRRLHARAGVGLQVDLSATLYEEPGGASKGKKAAQAPPRRFRHTVVDYGLARAITDGVVKRPVLEKVRVSGADGKELERVREGQPNAWLTYEALVRAGIGRWLRVREQMRLEGDARKPILFLLCANQSEAKEIANFLTYGEASREDLNGVRAVTGYVTPGSGERLFVEEDAETGERRSTVIEVHIGAKEERNEEEWAKVRERINAVDHDAVPNPRAHEPGEPATLPNPFNVVVSVMMLKEGWDVRNVKVIVPLRACDSRTLTEQTLGRGLRKMHAPEMDEDGAVRSVAEELYVVQHPSFDALLEEIADLVEVREPDEPDPPLEYVRVGLREPAEARAAVDVRWVAFHGVRERLQDWHERFRVDALPAGERLGWQEAFHDSDVETWLRAAGEDREDEAHEGGQRFSLAAVPTYWRYNELLDQVYALPLLRDVQGSFQEKLRVRAVVKDWLERRTFRLPAGVPLSFDRAVAAGPESGRIAVGNLLRPEVVGAVKDALRGPLREAISGREVVRTADLRVAWASGCADYAARKRHELEETRKSVFGNGAFDSADELRFAVMLDRCPDVTGWVYNHREGVGWSVEYDWQGHQVRYYPDFVVRVDWAGRAHNVVVEVKGRLDARDEAKVRAGRRYVALLSEHDQEPWHFLLVHQDAKVGQADLERFEGLAEPSLWALLCEVEGLFAPVGEGGQRQLLTQDGVRRRGARLASEGEGLGYGALMTLADVEVASRDQLLVAAEGLVTAREPQLERRFVERATGRVLDEAEVSRVLAAERDGDATALTGLEVVYRTLGRTP